MSKPVLHRRAEFEEVLENYEVSEHGQTILDNINLLLLRGPSAGGRNTIIRELLKTEKYEFLVSDTTRPKRVNDGIEEQDGVEYWFRGEDKVLADLQAGEFVEAELIHNQQVSGLSIREVEKSMKHGKICIHEAHREGVLNVLSVKSDAHAVFITPPSFEEWVKRLKGRGNMTEDEFKNRFESAEHDYASALNNRDKYTFVINDSYLLSTEHVRRIVETNDYPTGVNREALEVAEEIHDRIVQELAKD